MTKTILAGLIALAAVGCSHSFSSAPAPSINKATLIEDVSYLASDELKGRKSFSPEIDLAADYISQRFEQIGLVPLAGLNSYKQAFHLYQIKPKTLTVTVNQQDIAPEHAFVISSQSEINWDQTSEVTVTKVTAKDDFRAAVSNANQAGGNHVIFVDPAHAALVGRYHNYFSQGQTKSKLSNEGSLTVVLTPPQNAEQFTIKATMSIEKRPLANVIGVLPGKSKAKEMVIFSGHYDHIGIKEGQIYNGADDNASGTSALFSLAQYFADADNNERTLLFVGFTAEEMGLLGSANFTQLINADDVAAMVNLEMIGKVSKFGPGRLWMTGADKSNLKSLLNQSLPEEQKIEANPYPNMNLFYRSDNASLAKLGVPAHSFSSVQLDRDKHYHKPSDEVGTLDFESYYRAVSLLSVATQPLVTGEVTPSRVAPLPVRPTGKIF